MNKTSTERTMQMNKPVDISTFALPVMEDFYTLQGEGFHQGKAAYFIRLAGCDVGCVWCDVKESWDVMKHPLVKFEDLIISIKKTPAEMVVITGGEPLMHNLNALTETLHEAGLKTHLETSGAYPMTGSWDWICVSPKKFKAPLPALLPQANELKVVIFNKSDFDWAEKHAAEVSANCKLYLQPEWDKAALMTPLIIEYIKDHPQWELSLQIHKYINVP
jgi:7-carboxy-7-deazaguanine synthase